MLIRQRINRRLSRTASRRSGAVIVEFALVVSVFTIFLAALLEFGHAYLVISTLNTAAKRAARFGAVEGTTTAQVIAKANQYLSASIESNQATVAVLNGAVFDDPGFDASSFSATSLSPIELSEAESRQIFLVRVEVPYENVALMSPFFLRNLTLFGQSVMRHE